MNAVCKIFKALFYDYPIKAWRWFIGEMTNKEMSNARMASSIGFGAMMSSMPIWGFQMWVALAIAQLCKLNRAIVVTFSNISLPPVIPFILWGSLYTGGLILDRPTLLSIDNITLEEAMQSFLQYVLGAIVFSILLGLLFGLVSYTIMKFTRHSN
ncbi:MAG: DUF2062 domain-containing protein [Bacteroidales bacterium]|nr:DUF2062 domain-containing protein [Bacteroidales bacterium]